MDQPPIIPKIMLFVQFDGFTYEGNFCKSQTWMQIDVYGEIQELNTILNITKHFHLYCCDIMQTQTY